MKVRVAFRASQGDTLKAGRFISFEQSLKCIRGRRKGFKGDYESGGPDAPVREAELPLVGSSVEEGIGCASANGRQVFDRRSDAVDEHGLSKAPTP